LLFQYLFQITEGPRRHVRLQIEFLTMASFEDFLALMLRIISE
jgi:hypothetical protein